MAKKPKYLIAYIEPTGHVLGVSLIADLRSSESKLEIRKMFGETINTDYTMTWLYDGGPITESEIEHIAMRIRGFVRQGWVTEETCVELRMGNIGKKYVKSESCLVLQWDGLKLPYKQKSWKDFVACCRTEADELIRRNQIGPKNIIPLHSDDITQDYRESDPGYVEQVREQTLRIRKSSLDPEPAELDVNLVKKCAKLVENGKYDEACGLLADNYDIPPPKSSGKIQDYPLAYAFYDTPSSTVLYYPITEYPVEDIIYVIVAGFFRYMAQYRSWSFHPDPTSSLNIELDMSTNFGSSAVYKLTDGMYSGPSSA